MGVACGGMNFRILDSSKVHLTDAVSLLSTLSGVYADGGGARIDRMVIGACARAGIELGDQALIHADACWVSGTSTGSGITVGSGSKAMAANTAINGNAGGDVTLPSTSVDFTIILKSCYYRGCFTGVTRVNSPNGNGSALYDGSGVDTGSSVQVIGAAGGSTGTVSGVVLNWTRDKDRYCFDGRLTATTIGDWTGYLTVSLPFTVTANTAISATTQTTGAVLSGYATGTQLRLYTASGAFPIANGQTILFTGAARA
ncbi:hypothetical protein LOY64_14640 [Pseudomonas corrugata]|uniref:hypothetical protein n=1 Tax=Pseudomonas corrugata TaxID=47879 RepID=UPI0022329B2C|nr:hypothetical protein [Pseudomonas corrugata]UZD98171.1 hypothetical protein LOY64_14640 [Pseudomonas corrugata]